MKFYGSLQRLTLIKFQQNLQDLTLSPNLGTTYTAARSFQLPPGDASDTVVGAAATQTLTNKTMSGASNTFSNISLTSAVSGILPVANGGTNASTASGARTSLGAAASGANSDITSLSGLTTPLSIGQGGTNSSTALNNNRVIQSSGGAIVEAAAITAARALISDANGIPTHSAVTSTELGYVSGVTSAIQTQIDGKASTALGNLASVAINTSLLPASDNAIDLGSSAKEWRSAYLKTSLVMQQPSGGTSAITLQSPTTLTSWSLTLPQDAGTNGYVLATNGSGVTSWVSNASTNSFKADWSQVSHTVTISHASPGVVSWTAHGLVNGQALYFTTDGTLPSPLVPGQIYYVVSAATDTFEVAATFGGSAINTTSDGSGTHTANVTSINVVHNLASSDVMVQLYDKADGSTIDADMVLRTDTNNVLVNASEIPSVSGWRVMVLAV